MINRRAQPEASVGYLRETFTLPVGSARAKAREILDRFPIGGYSTIIEYSRQQDDGQVEFTIRQLPTAD